ncbi:hypothetical protein ABK040_011985 [Willaertia magna]
MAENNSSDNTISIDNSNNNTTAIVVNFTDEKKTKSSRALSVVSKNSSNTGKNKKEAFALKFHTCFGNVELTPVKLASLLGMAVTIISFLALAAIMIASYVLQTQSRISDVVYRGDMLSIRETLTYTSLLAFYSETPAKYVSIYNTTLTQLLSLINILLRNERFAKTYASYNMTTSAVGLENKALTLLMKGQRAEGFKIINSTEYQNSVERFKNDSLSATDFLLMTQENIQQSMIAITLVGLIVIIVTLILILPVVIGIFTFSIDKEGEQLKRLKAAKAVMLLDTMNNSKLKELFRKHCETEHSIENFKFLEKATFYKELCEHSFEIQEKLYGSESTGGVDNDTSSVTNSEISSKSNKSTKKKESFEKDLKEIEKRKYECAFDVYTDFLDLNGKYSVNINKQYIEEVKTQLDFFNRGQSETLAEALFDDIVREISIVMLDTHQRFKSSLAFQKQMKIQNIKNKKSN